MSKYFQPNYRVKQTVRQGLLRELRRPYQGGGGSGLSSKNY